MVLAFQDRLRLSITDRARAFEDQVERDIARVGNTGPGITRALELFAHYARALINQVAQSWEDSPTSQFKVASLQMLNRHLRDRVDLYDSRFARGHLSVPSALAAAVERECELHGAPGREAVLTVGPPANFTTFVADLRATLFRQLQVDPKLPESLTAAQLVLIAMPDLEGTRAAWQPIVVGHELAHYLQTVDPVLSRIGLEAVLDRQRLASTTDPLPASVPGATPRTRALEQIAVRWMNELVCDAYAVHRFGAAGVAAVAEFLESVGAARVSSRSHPPGLLRTRLMFGWLGDDIADVEREIADPLRSLAGDVNHPDWSVYLSTTLGGLAERIQEVVADWSRVDPYDGSGRTDVIEALAGHLATGIPGVERVLVAGNARAVEPGDVVNASWLAIHRGAVTPVNRLTLKALDTLNFLSQWSAAGGETRSDDNRTGEAGSQGALTEPQIHERLSRDDSDRLVITPLLPASVKGASVDLRMGNRFIVFERSTAPAFDALDPVQDPRSMQVTVERAWGDVLYLHPGQLVLASTLEYLVLPGDLTAQVITRSSYGRLGLISATAVQVHPHFAGCLTLELVNLGEMPMAITPGERVAQLMLFTTSSKLPAPAVSDDKYRYPTGPEFSKVHADVETEVLRTMRRRFDERVGRRSL